MHLPSPIQAFFEAEKEATNTNPPVDAFTPDAVVKDEGNTYVGKDSIADWWRSAKGEFQHTSEPLDIREEGALTKVSAMVTGNFPTSPARLTFAFLLTGEKISELEITP